VTLSLSEPVVVPARRRLAAPPLVLVAHGSRDPRSASTMRGLAARVARVWPAPVTAAFLDFNEPTVADVLRGVGPSVVVPCLLTSAYHGRVDVPQVLADAGVPAGLAAVLGPAEPGDRPDPRLLAALARRVSELDTPYDALVLVAAGTSYAAARSTVEDTATALGASLGVPCRVGYASASGPTPAESVVALRAAGAGRVAAASYFLAPGRLYDLAVASARSAGALAVAGPLGAADEIVDLVVSRARQPHRARS
jgi:sirohydrochlorin ferrochelatase